MSLCREYIDIFSTSVLSLSALVEPMVIEIFSHLGTIPQAAICTQINKLLELGVIEESQVSGVKPIQYLRATVNRD
jgi:predicted transcriptional regulator